MGLLEFEFKSDNMIRSKAIKDIVNKILAIKYIVKKMLAIKYIVKKILTDYK